MNDDEVQVLAFLKEWPMIRAELYEHIRKAWPENANACILLDQSIEQLQASRYIIETNGTWHITKPGRLAFNQSVIDKGEVGYEDKPRRAPLLRIAS